MTTGQGDALSNLIMNARATHMIKPLTLDYVCTSGSSATGCMNPVSEDDPDQELCHECMQVEILKLEESLDDVMTRLLRYRRAAA